MMFLFGVMLTLNYTTHERYYEKCGGNRTRLQRPWNLFWEQKMSHRVAKNVRKSQKKDVFEAKLQIGKQHFDVFSFEVHVQK